jgi:hypothetical protein
MVSYDYLKLKNDSWSDANVFAADILLESIEKITKQL